MDPCGLQGEEMHGMSSISWQHISAVCLRLSMVFLKNTSSVCVTMRGTAACQTKAAINHVEKQ
jgi:hypothetical protein